ncbi:cytochrome c biogenesis protein CcsA [Spongiibacter nanhainus]|uniref:Cytochrome c biogenesis protein CcsA n=1 Tax=Spongiibacter nanhainus TaxID=2794344 RepID=A0A7T4R2M7_9GAMM|nr:cytochrome c biogenesis protein CcsA [Spongiibacter nanhainus]QQD19245.1 cytochrome c biogenesis protein CcsA [Spongiibacter nanhainus]
MNTATSFIAITLYIVATALQLRRMRAASNSTVGPGPTALAIGALATACHLFAAASAIHTPDGAHLGAIQVMSLVGATIVVITLSASLRRPLHNLLMVVYPLATVLLLAEWLTPAAENLEHYSTGVLSHIVLSILSYSVLTMAAAQALILWVQDSRLRHHRLTGFHSLLPPIQTMEAMLFELIWAGLILLTLAIVTGAIYVDDLLAQHLAHKTVFSLLAWLLFAVLLGGRMILGWRGRIAIRWTLGAFACLLLGYLGTKVALTVITL